MYLYQCHIMSYVLNLLPLKWVPAGASDARNAGDDVANAENTSSDVANAGNARNDVANETHIAGNATSIGSVSQQGSVSQVLLMMMVITAITAFN